MPQYFEAIRLAGGEPVQVALDLDNHQIARLATTCDAVLLPGSRADVNPQKYGAARHPRTQEDDPLRDNADELLLQDAYNMHKPVLGICFGLQSLNVWRTGTLLQHITSPVPHAPDSCVKSPTHRVVIDAASRLAEMVRAGLCTAGHELAAHPERSEASAFLEIEVNSSHHQAALQPGDGLKPVAWCPDDQVIEALEGTAPDHWILAVQWHPERMLNDPAAQALFLSFVEAARQRRAHPRTTNVDFEMIRQ
jgi:putative glutamine amidotransferase